MLRRRWQPFTRGKKVELRHAQLAVFLAHSLLKRRDDREESIQMQERDAREALQHLVDAAGRIAVVLEQRAALDLDCVNRWAQPHGFRLERVGPSAASEREV